MTGPIGDMSMVHGDDSMCRRDRTGAMGEDSESSWE